MNSIVFYSWQSDLPNATNRGFIQKALENAAKAIRDDDSIEVEPVVDRDTAGVPGSPDIGMTIFEKIEKAQVFVCDLSLINTGSMFISDEEGVLKIDENRKPPRLTPNPNVLLELGYALKTLGPRRILMVFNTAYGKTEDLPFDLRTKRVISYYMPNETVERAPERKDLENVLKAGLLAILVGGDVQAVGEEIQPKSRADQAIEAIEAGKPNQALSTRRFMEELAERVNDLAPDFSTVGSDQYDELLVQAIDQSLDLVIDLAHVAEIIAAMNSLEAAQAMFKGFERIAQGYNLPIGFSGVYSPDSFCFHRFIGHELFVSFISFLIREEQWNIVTELLAQDLNPRNIDSDQGRMLNRFYYLSEFVGLLDYRNKRLKSRSVSLHADLLHKRHAEGPLASLVASEQFMETDYFLFLRGFQEPHRSSGWSEWPPWSTFYMGGRSRAVVPGYLQNAERQKNAEKLLEPLGLEDIEGLKHLLSIEAPKLAALFRDAVFWHHPLVNFDVNAIGSRR